MYCFGVLVLYKGGLGSSLPALVVALHGRQARARVAAHARGGGLGLLERRVLRDARVLQARGGCHHVAALALLGRLARRLLLLLASLPLAADFLELCLAWGVTALVSGSLASLDLDNTLS